MVITFYNTLHIEEAKERKISIQNSSSIRRIYFLKYAEIKNLARESLLKSVLVSFNVTSPASEHLTSDVARITHELIICFS